MYSEGQCIHKTGRERERQTNTLDFRTLTSCFLCGFSDNRRKGVKDREAKVEVKLVGGESKLFS